LLFDLLSFCSGLLKHAAATTRPPHLLEVVDDEQHLPLPDVLNQAVRGAERLSNLIQNQSGIAQRGNSDPKDT
jgi:hypothetical protein